MIVLYTHIILTSKMKIMFLQQRFVRCYVIKHFDTD